MSNLIYPGIWGVLQPVKVNVVEVTSLLFPIDVLERLRIGPPQLLTESSMRTSLYSYTFSDSLLFGMTSIVSGSLLTTIAYQTLAFGDVLNFGMTSIPSGSLIDTIAYQSLTYADTLIFGMTSITNGDLVVTIAYQTTSYADTLTFGLPSITSASSLVVV